MVKKFLMYRDALLYVTHITVRHLCMAMLSVAAIVKLTRELLGIVPGL